MYMYVSSSNSQFSIIRTFIYRFVHWLLKMALKPDMWWGFLCLYWLAVPAASIFWDIQDNTAAVTADFLEVALAFGLGGLVDFEYLK